MIFVQGDRNWRDMGSVGFGGSASPYSVHIPHEPLIGVIGFWQGGLELKFIDLVPQEPRQKRGIVRLAIER